MKNRKKIGTTLVTILCLIVLILPNRPDTGAASETEASCAEKTDTAAISTTANTTDTTDNLTSFVPTGKPVSVSTDAPMVTFHDSAVEAEVRQLLKKETEPIRKQDMTVFKTYSFLKIYGECRDVEDIVTYFPNLTKLVIEQYSGSDDVCGALSALSRLKSLELTDSAGRLNIDGLARLPDLESVSLNVPELQFSSTDVLSGSKKLRSFTLTNISQCDLSFLLKIAGINQVELLNCGITDVSMLTDSRQIQKLVISYGKGAGTQDGLASFAGIRDNGNLSSVERRDSDILAGYERVRDSDSTYEIFETYDRQYTEDSGTIPECGMTVFRQNGQADAPYAKVISTVISDKEAEPNYPSFSRMVTLTDVNFDSQKDILILDGYYGNQGGARYSCWLWNSKTQSYEPKDSFKEIMNVSIDRENHKILGCCRNNAASHSYFMYEYIGGKFVLTSQLTIEADENSDFSKNIKWNFTDERLTNGKMKMVEQTSVLSSGDGEAADSKYDRKGSYWDLAGDKWTQLDCDGKLADFSIYSDR